MNREQGKRPAVNRRRRTNRVLMIVFAAVLFAGLFSQIAMVARLSGQNKRVWAIEREIRDLNANADNLNLSLNQFRSLDRVAAQAARLGMAQPGEGQIRVVNLPDYIDYTSAQSADNSGAEEMRE